MIAIQDLTTFWVEVAKQVPAMGLLVAVFVVFLRYLDRVAASRDADVKDSREDLKRLIQEARASEERSRLAFEKVSELLSKIDAKLDRNSGHK